MAGVLEEHRLILHPPEGIASPPHARDDVHPNHISPSGCSDCPNVAGCEPDTDLTPLGILVLVSAATIAPGDLVEPDADGAGRRADCHDGKDQCRNEDENRETCTRFHKP